MVQEILVLDSPNTDIASVHGIFPVPRNLHDLSFLHMDHEPTLKIASVTASCDARLFSPFHVLLRHYALALAWPLGRR